jgi:hypothetical protein
MGRPKIVAAVLVSAVTLSWGAPAFAQADKFGPGAGTGGGIQKCHPPGQTKDVPGCK